MSAPDRPVGESSRGELLADGASSVLNALRGPRLRPAPAGIRDLNCAQTPRACRASRRARRMDHGRTARERAMRSAVPGGAACGLIVAAVGAAPAATGGPANPICETVRTGVVCEADPLGTH